MYSLPKALRTKVLRLVLGLLLAALFVSLSFLATGQEKTTSGRDKPDILTSRPAQAQAPLAALKVGEEIITVAGQRRRLQLADGSVLFVNQQTEAKLTDAGRLAVKTGEVYVEVPFAKTSKDPLIVTTPHLVLTGGTSHFDVRVDEAGSRVIVARGSLQVSGVKDKLTAGQQLLSGDNKIDAAPRLSQALDWTRELLLAAQSPLIPGSEHAGGALVAIDPKGQEAKLELRKFHIDVFIEDGFARTTIDQTYFNHEAEQLEGTFYFPLPPDASLSRLAMYVNGVLREGGMAERDLARQTYESIRYYNRDPALLEWVDGSTFKMRVFPIEARQEKRLVLSYSQWLPSLNGQAQYRFPAGHSLQIVKDWSFRAQVKYGKDWSSSSHKLEKSPGSADDLVLSAAAKNARTDRDVVLTLSGKAEKLEDARYSSTIHSGHQYFMVRYRPDLREALPQGGRPGGERRDWVFLFEASGDRDPLLARVQIDVLRRLLHYASAEDRFTILTANTRVKAWSKELVPATVENVQSALAYLEGAHLIGALDLGQAFYEAAKFVQQADNPYLVHLGSGIAAMGERRHDELFPLCIFPGVRYVGIGVGRRWDRSFMKTAAQRTGGQFTQINPDEEVPWRAFDLFAGLNMPRLHNVSVADPASKAVFHSLSQSVSQGEEVCAIAKLMGDQLPEKVVITGQLDGKPWTKTVAVKNVTKKAEYLPRTWAKLEIDRLLAEDALKNKEAIIALSKSMYVMTPFTSLLVLENDDQHAQFKIDFGRKDHWAMYACPDKIEVVYEPLEGMPDPKSVAGVKPTAKQVIRTIAGYVERQVIFMDYNSASFAPGALTATGVVSPTIDAFASPVLPGKPFPGAGLAGFAFTNANLGLGRFPSSPEARSQMLSEGFFNGASVDAFLRPQAAIGAVRRLARKPDSFGGDLGARDSNLPSNFYFHKQDRILVLNGETKKLSKELLRLGDLAPVPLEAPPSPSPMGGNERNPDFLYHRPTCAVPDAAFFDLIAYAPGMANSTADVKAVLESEARPTIANKPGKIDAKARDLFTKARNFGWQSWTLPGEKGQSSFAIYFDGTGKYAYDRLFYTLPGNGASAGGIREIVACDGQTQLHLYPLLGIGAQRTVSRFHRADFADVVPWAVPDPADLTYGADLLVIAERTVAIVPHQEATWHKQLADKKDDDLYWHRVHLIFGEDGKLAERQLVKMPKGEIVSRRICGADGVVRLLGAKDKELSVINGKLSPATAPNLTPDTKDLVVLPLPYRTADHVLKLMKDNRSTLNDARFKEALPLFAAHVAAGNANEANNVFRQVFYAREQRQLGFYVLLASCGANLDSQNGDVLAEHLENPVAQYLALHSSPVLRKHASQWAMNSDQWQDGFLQYLGQTHAILQRWENHKVLKGDPAKVANEKRRALEYVKKHKDTDFAWVLLCHMQNRADKEEQAEHKEFHLALAACWNLFKDIPGLQYAARYETARSLYQAGNVQEAQGSFRELYEATLKDDLLPSIDEDFRRCLQMNAADDPWSQLITKTASQLIEKKHRPAVLALARQVWRLEDQPLAQHLLTLALPGPATPEKEDKERVAISLAVVHFLQEKSQFSQADEHLQKLLADVKLAERADLWRLASTLADQRDMPARSIECLEKALDLEFRERSPSTQPKPNGQPKVIDLEQVRRDYGTLLNHYQSLADAMVALKLRPPEDFLAKVVRTADRWRALDMETANACSLTANILQRLGDRELGWDYLTTPIGMRPNESGPWGELAGNLSRKGELKLADRAYQAAFASEPTNAQILWDRAQNLLQAGETQAAFRLYRQLAEGTWQPRFQGIQTQARSRLKEK